MTENNEKSESEETESDIIEKRKEKISGLLKVKKDSAWSILSYFILAVIVGISIFIRTRNLQGLKDITTNTWTLGPDLDPFLFLRWAQYIVDHGKLMLIDTMRYAPVGYNVSGEAKLLSYLIAWFYDILSIFNKDVTVTYAAVIFPVFMFALTCIAFFFLVRKIFEDSFENKSLPGIIALIATFFLAITPEILPRTIAGIPEKESVGFLLIALSLYFFICSFKSKNYKGSLIYGALAGIATAILGLVWGGVTFVFSTIGLSVFVFFMLGQIDKNKLYGYVSWIVFFMPISMFFSTRYTIMNYVSSTSTMPIFLTLLLIIFDLFIYDRLSKIKSIKKLEEKYKIPRQIFALVLIGVVAFILVILVFGFKFISYEINDALTNLLKPLSANRFTITVAENRQPYFSELNSSFGPVISNIALYFWLFIIGSVALFYNTINKFDKKERTVFLGGYIIMILALIFSKFSPNSVLNGESTTSLVIYFGGVILFLALSLYILIKYNSKDKKALLKLNFNYILIFTLFFISILAARSAVRFVMMLVPVAGIMVGYLIVSTTNKINKNKEEMIKITYIILAILIILTSVYSAFTFYQISVSQASSFYPSSYNWQWQKAMDWVRNNTDQNAVFSHWWDYGYWIQSIGNRATVLDGGNAIVYWNHLLGRHVLTTPDDSTALEFLYTHNATHLLIDSTDIGKYSAFSSIGADENYDRYSYIPTLAMDSRATRETKNGLLYIYNAGIGLDDDIVIEENGTKIFFPKETSALGAVLIEEKNNEGNSSELTQPRAILIKQSGEQKEIPLRYLFYKNKLYDYHSGLNAGVFIVSVIQPVNNQIQMNDKGALLYLSNRTVDSLLVRKYLFEEEGNFKLVHSEDNFLIADLKNQNVEIDDFAYYQGTFLGPIKIWEIKYPSTTRSNPAYLETEYPNEALRQVK